MKNKLTINDALGSVVTTEKGFLRQYVVTDGTGEKSVVKIFCKEVGKLPTKSGQEVVVECNEFCFA